MFPSQRAAGGTSATSTRSGRRATSRTEQLGAGVACNDVLLARLRVLQLMLAQSGSSYFSFEVDRLRTNPSPEAPPTNVANRSRSTRSYSLSSKISQKRYKMLRPYVAPFLRTTTISFRIVLVLA
ncbi:hypothetical protein EDB92DRAFT_66684 [Lactarius akahatsu]|uniref:Uncharacterized protein n=1 Tax=Lactarius akahatsu TaxID=416441 RepID=A0AAD4QI58_9AGAM|nr:hypothetical protein EDB92DRAFT_66684 [Lactarius akahatsu]